MSNNVMSDGDKSNTGPPPPCHVEAVARQGNKERELMLLETAEHIKMARALRALYQTKVELAVAAALAKRDHEDMEYTTVVDYGQNMELPR